MDEINEIEYMKEPTAIVPEMVKCQKWGNCVHGAGCLLSNFQSENKKMPLVVIIDGVPHCYTFKKG